MRRRNRMLLAAVFVAGGALAVWGLTRLSSGTEGPLSRLLGGLGSGVASLEHRASRMVRGPGRSEQLAWLEPLRADPARLRRPDTVLLGAYDGDIPRTLDGVVRLERAIGAGLPLIQTYAAWGDKPEQQFPRAQLTAISDLGSIPMLTWEPWLTDFENARHPNLPLRGARERHGLATVARGDYDFYIDAWATAARGFRKPFLIRLAHEMNDPYRYPWGPQNNTKEEYVAAWRRVVERFRLAGATNVLWVWSPHVAYEYWDLYYPGDAWVDWIATGVLNFGPIAHWSRWWTFDEIFGAKYERLASFGKPIMVAELGSLAVGGDRAEWYRAALADLPRRYPAIRAVLLFHTADDQTVTYQKVSWTVVDDAPVLAAIRAAIGPWAPGRLAADSTTTKP